MRRILLPLVFGLAGCAVLISLGVWQVQRLAWKQGILAEIEARIAEAPAALPEAVDPARDQYLSVQASGEYSEEVLRVLVSQKHVGAGYRLITPLKMQNRTVLVDRGFIKVDHPVERPPVGPVTVIGNLLWPDERNSSTPANDLAGNTWFARDIAQMAETLQTAPILIVARETSPSDPAVTPLPVDSAGIPNDHLSYAITWFSLAAIWAIMTCYFLWRMRHPDKQA